MTDIPQQRQSLSQVQSFAPTSFKRARLLLAALFIVASVLALSVLTSRLQAEGDYFVDSTLGQLALWMADQSEEEAPESVLGQIAQQRRVNLGVPRLDESILLAEMHGGLVTYTAALTALAVISSIGLLFNLRGHRMGLLVTMVGINALIYVFPPVSGQHLVSLVLLCVSATGLTLLLSRPHVERVVGFLVVLSAFTVAWEGSKAFASLIDYRVTLPATAWEYQTYDDLDGALAALQAGEIDLLLADRRDLDEQMPPYPVEEADPDAPPFTYPDLRYIHSFNRQETRLGRPVTPELAGRVSAATSAEQAANLTSITQFADLNVGTVTGSYAETDYLAAERDLVLLDLKITNDLNLPHLQSIAEALLQPARRNGPLLLVRILYRAALYTWTEALIGFVFGATLGFVLGSVFAHIPLLQRSLLPYVVASQTIPIIAIAPMIVIWLRDTHPLLPVAVISAYLTFFPVTVNTLRGLQSPDAISVDLMNSFAANKWQIMWKLRFPAALPYIFTALKVSATASVVGAIIGELPSGIRNGLGRAILDFSSDYSLISTPKLWAAIFMAAVLGIVFFLIVAVIEFILLRGQSEPVQ